MPHASHRFWSRLSCISGVSFANRTLLIVGKHSQATDYSVGLDRIILVQGKGQTMTSPKEPPRKRMVP